VCSELTADREWREPENAEQQASQDWPSMWSLELEKQVRVGREPPNSKDEQTTLGTFSW
jgi:hypothetical protein